MRVLLLVLLSTTLSVAQATKPATQPAFNVGRIEDPAIPENSGIIPAKTLGVFWTLNDSGNPPMLFAIDGQGKTLASFKADAKNTDWEDIAADDDGNLYIADIGNNTGQRKTVQVHRLAEPDLTAAGPLKVTHTWEISYPNKPFDAESLFIFKQHGYIISKHRDMSLAGLYRFPLTEQKEPAVLEKVCDLPIRFPVTAADIGRDGKQIAVLSVAGPYLFDLPTPGDVPSIAKVTPKSVTYGDVHMEAVCFTADGLLATSEKRPMLLFRWADFGK